MNFPHDRVTRESRYRSSVTPDDEANGPGNQQKSNKICSKKYCIRPVGACLSRGLSQPVSQARVKKTSGTRRRAQEINEDRNCFVDVNGRMEIDFHLFKPLFF